jgi:hypothetical protein
MYRIILSAAVVAAAAFSTTPASAVVQSCVTVGGVEKCESAEHSLVCQTVDGYTSCVKDAEGTVIQQYQRHERKVGSGKPSVSQDLRVDTPNSKVRIENGRIRVETPRSKVIIGDDEDDD